MVPKFQDSELKVMAVLWKNGDMKARDIAGILEEENGWNLNTTYTLIKRCIKKGGILKKEPNYICHALVPQEEVQKVETKEFIDKIYDGSESKLFAALLKNHKVEEKEIAKLKDIIEKWD